MKQLFFAIIILSAAFLNAQVDEKKAVNGNVTYISSQNIYVKFENTDGINSGDTLYIQKNNNLLPAILAEFISSQSVAGKKIIDDEIKTGDEIIAFVEFKEEVIEDKKEFADTTIDIIEEFTETRKEEKEIESKTTNINGRLSAKSYSSLTNMGARGNFQRWRYSLQFNADNIGGSELSFTNYTNFSYRANEWQSVTENLGRSLKVYDLALKYDFNPKTRLWFGRHLNRKVSNLSTIDGLQFEHYFSDYFGGVIVGSRPNYYDMGVNLKLFEFGGYFGRTDTINNNVMENTIGFFNQTNDFKTDRRFLYFQHRNYLIENVNLFLSTEIDLYKKELGQSKSDFILTSLFLSARFRPSRTISFSLSYDARKRVIYYETFKSLTDSIIENETRQGFRLRTTIRPFNKLVLGLNAGYRFMPGDIKPSRNFGGYISYSRLPFIKATPSISYTRLLSNYVDGSIIGVRLSKSLSFNNSSLTIGYRNTNYTFLSTDNNLNQNIFSIDFSTKILSYLYLSTSYEGTFEKKNTYNRVLMGLTARF